MTQPAKTTVVRAGRMDDPWHWCHGPFELALFSDVSPAKSTPNEDCVAVVILGSDELVLVVADGVGGMPDGVVASRIVAEEIVARCEDAARTGTRTREAVLDAIEHANRRILRESQGSATTVAVAHVAGDEVRTLHVGDSEIQLFAGTEGLRWKTLSHSPVGYALEAGMLDPRQALWNEARHLVSNVLGSPTLSVEVSSALPLRAGDTLLLASDGLHDNLHLEEIHAVIVGEDAAAAGRELVRRVRQRMADPSTLPCKPDDLSFVLLRRLGEADAS